MWERWSTPEHDLGPFVERARRRSAVLAEGLRSRAREPDADLVEGHAAWISSLFPDGPQGHPLAEMFLVRLGDWVEGHAQGFVPQGDELKTLGEEDRAAVAFPSSFPAPPPFEPLETPQVSPPGETRFRFGILADLHFGSARADATAAAAVEDLNRSGAELVIQLGDITDQGDKEEFEMAAKVLGRLEMPLVTMLGNHDVYSRKEQRLSGGEYYAPSFGRDAEGVILEHKGFRFAVLDSAERGASPFAPFDIVTGQFTSGAGGAIVRGSLTPPQHDLLAEVAAPGGAPTFMFMHHPPQPFTSFPPVLFGLRDTDSGRVHATCDSGNVWGFFAGHTHRNARTRMFGNVPAHEVAIPRDYPFGYALVDVAEEGYAYRFHQISDRDVLEAVNASAGDVQRRYARGSDEELAFAWTKPPH